MVKYDHLLDEFFMRRALELAVHGQGFVSPNPMVGSVIVHDSKVIGEGWHTRYGEAHAEVNAVSNIKDKHLLGESTIYVNLEPCTHYGKTPPCADMLIGQSIKRAVVANVDPNPLVSGRGLERLRAAGIEVTSGILEDEGRTLNRRFFTMMEKQRPYIILKWAQTADGFMARENFDSKWISNEYSRQLTHKWRTEEDGILVGTTTADRDNPLLTVRDWTGRNPARIVLDRHLRLGPELHLFDRTVKTICYNLMRDEISENLIFVKLDAGNFFSAVVRDLHQRKIQSVMIEGGPTTLNEFISQGLWDEARIFRSQQHFGKGIAAPLIAGKSIDTGVMGDMVSVIYPDHKVINHRLEL